MYLVLFEEIRPTWSHILNSKQADHLHHHLDKVLKATGFVKFNQERVQEK